MNVTTDREQTLEQLAAQADLYLLLSLFLHLPTLELAEGLLDSSLASDVEQILSELGLRDEQAAEALAGFKALAAKPEKPEDYLHELRAEYTRLFTHPTNAVLSLYEAVFLYRESGQGRERPLLFTNPAALDAERIYRKAGLARSDETNESGDHFATQLEFASFLLRQRITLLDGEPEALAANQAIFEEFEEAHLSKWARPLFSRLADEAWEPAYQALGRLGVAILRETPI